MISTDGGITAKLIPLDATLFKCFDPIDDEDADFVSLDDNSDRTPKTVFDSTGHGFDTFEEPKPEKPKPAKKLAAKNKRAPVTLTRLSHLAESICHV